MNISKIPLKDRKWTNHYISLVETKADIIVSSGDCVLEQEKEVVKNKTSAFKDIYCELGSGSGNHLIERAALEPNAAWVGFEIRFKRVYRTAQKAEERGLNNLVVVRNSAHKITEFFQPGSLSGIYVNFPDPWDKKRWHKHRLMQEPFLTTLSHLLRPGGFIAYKTDHQGSFLDLCSALEQRSDGKILQLTHDLYAAPQLLSNNVATEFELLFINQKLPIYFLRWVKSS